MNAEPHRDEANTSSPPLAAAISSLRVRPMARVFRSRMTNARVVLLVLGVAILLIVFRVIPIAPRALPLLVKPPAELQFQYVDGAASQLDSATDTLHAIAVGLFVLAGFRYKDQKDAVPVTHFEFAWLIAFFVAEFFNAYYGYYLRVGLIENFSFAQFNHDDLLKILAYQAYAVVTAGVAAVAVFANKFKAGV